MNAWLVAALVYIALMVPLGLASLRRPAIESAPALQVAGTNGSIALLLLSIGFDRQPFVDLALVLALLSFTGTLAFASVLERSRR